MPGHGLAGREPVTLTSVSTVVTVATITPMGATGVCLARGLSGGGGCPSEPTSVPLDGQSGWGTPNYADKRP